MQRMIIILGLLVAYANAACYINYKSSGCNDNEMFNQCNYAQQQINDYAKIIMGINDTYELVKHIPNLNCSQHIVCYAPNHAYCQNLDSYEACLGAKTELSKFITDASQYIAIPVNLLESMPNFVCAKKDTINNYGVADFNEINTAGHMHLSLFLILMALVMCF